MTGVLAQSTDEAYLVLLDIVHETGTFRICNNSTDVSYGGVTYFTYPFDIILPTNESEKVPAAQLTIDNVSRTLIDELRTQSSHMTAAIRIVAASDMVAGEHCAMWVEMQVRSVEYNSTSISCRLTNENYLAEPFPKGLFTQDSFPGLFGRGVDGTYEPPPPPPSSPTGYTDFSEYVTDDSIWIYDWTAEPVGEGINPGDNGTVTVIADAGATGGKKLFIDVTTNNRGLYQSWDRAGDGNTVQHLLMHGWYTDGDDQVGNALALCITDINTGGHDEIDFYSCSINHNQFLSLSIERSGGRPDDLILAPAFELPTLSGGDEYWIECKYESGLLYAKAWVDSYANRPGAWAYDGIADAVLTGGRLGIMGRGTSTGTRSYNHDEFSYSTDGTVPTLP